MRSCGSLAPAPLNRHGLMLDIKFSLVTTSPYFKLQFRKLRISGNGPGVAEEPIANQLTVTFNPSDERPLSVRGEIQISNWKHAGLLTDCRPFVVAAPCLEPAWCQQFEDLLRNSALTLEPILRCFPSSGLVAIHAALQVAEQVYVYRMPLKPSFIRPPGMSSRKPLPCAFHNWLGERRLGFSLLRENGPERLIWDSLTPEALTNSGEPTDTDPVTALENLFGQARSDLEGEFAETLNWLAALERRAWACNAEETRLTTLERHFFLSRHNPVTPNWWLFNNRLSAPLDAVLQRLMVCQVDLVGG